MVKVRPVWRNDDLKAGEHTVATSHSTDASMSDAQAYSVKLSAKEEEMLVQMAGKPSQQLSLTIDKPNSRTIGSLVRKGMARDIMGTFWEITPAGRLRVTKIY